MIKFFNNRQFNFTSKFRIANYMSLGFIIVGILFFFIKGPELGVDFKGGTELIIKLDSKFPNKNTIISYLNQNNINYSNVKSYGDDKVRILFDLDFNEQLVKSKFNVISYNKIGSTISNELKYDAMKALFIAVMLIGLYIIIRFDWYTAIGGIIALVHDILIAISMLIFFSYEFDINIIATFLIIMGYSLNDTIVVFDRMRENISEYSNMKLDEIINLSLNEILARTLITSLTTLFVVVSIYVFGGGSLKGLSFGLIVGILSGTYSSIFVATPVMMFLRDKYYVEENEGEA